MNKATRFFDISTAFLSTCGLSVSLQDISNYLNIILLIISIINIIIVLVFKIYNIVCDGKVTNEEIEELKKEIDEANDEIENILK